MDFIAYNNVGYEDKITQKEVKQLKDIVIFIQQKNRGGNLLGTIFF